MTVQTTDCVRVDGAGAAAHGGWCTTHDDGFVPMADECMTAEANRGVGYAVLIQRDGLTPSLLGPYPTIDDAESEVADLALNGQEGSVQILPLLPGWAAPTASLHLRCSVCLRLVPTDPRGAVLDGSGRCTQCQP